jgi:hypothetical protein
MEETHPSLRMPLASHLHLRRRLHVGGWVVLGVPIGSFLSSITAGLAWADFNVGHPGLVTGNVRTYSSIPWLTAGSIAMPWATMTTATPMIANRFT